MQRGPDVVCRPIPGYGSATSTLFCSDCAVEVFVCGGNYPRIAVCDCCAARWQQDVKTSSGWTLIDEPVERVPVVVGRGRNGAE